MDPYLQQLFKSPNDFRLIDGIFVRIGSGGSDIQDLQSMPKEHRVVLDIWGSKGILDNGGFQFFFECNFADFCGIVDSYDTVGVGSIADAIRQALKLFPNSQPHADVELRLQYLDGLGPSAKEKLKALSKLIWESDVEVLRKTAAYTRLNQAAFSMLQPTEWEDISELEEQDIPPPVTVASEIEIARWLESIDARCCRLENCFPHDLQEISVPNIGNPIVYIRLSDERNSTDLEVELLSKYSALQELRILNLDNSLITKEGLKQIVHFPNLQEIRLQNTQVGDDWLTPLVFCKKLKVVDLTNTAVTSESFAIFAKIKTLESLSFWNTEITDSMLGDLASLSQLRSINFGDTALTGSAINELGAVPLEEISLRLAKVTDNGLEGIVALKNLRVVNAGETRIGNLTLQNLAKCKRIEELDISYTAVTDAGLTHLEFLGELRSLNLGHTAIGDSGLLHVAKLLNLRELNLGGTKITAKTGLLGLAELKFLESLTLPANLMGKANALSLKKMLPKAEFSFE